MPEVVNSEPEARQPQLPVHGDGQWRPLQSALTVFTFVVGILVFAIGFIVRAHLPATVIGVVTLVVGLFGQMISNTRAQRVLIVTGIIGAFVGMGLSIAHGGFGS